MGKLIDFETGHEIRPTAFGNLLASFDKKDASVAWNKLPKAVRAGIGLAATAAVMVPSAAIISSYEANKDAAAHPEQDSVLCLPESSFTAESGDTLSEKGEDRLKELKTEANEQDVPLDSATGAQVREYQLANELLNGTAGIERGTEYKLGRVCVVAAEDGTPQYAVVQK